MKLWHLLILVAIGLGVYVYTHPDSDIAGKAKGTLSGLKSKLSKSEEKPQPQLITDAVITFADESGKRYGRGDLKVTVTPALDTAISLSTALKNNATDLNTEVQGIGGNVTAKLGGDAVAIKNKADEIDRLVRRGDIDDALLKLDELAIDVKRFRQTISNIPLSKRFKAKAKNGLLDMVDALIVAIEALDDELTKVHEGGYSGYTDENGAVRLATAYTYKPYKLVIEEGIGRAKIYPLNTTTVFVCKENEQNVTVCGKAKVTVERRATLMPIVVKLNNAEELGSTVTVDAGKEYIFTFKVKAQGDGKVRRPYILFSGDIATFSAWAWIYSDNGLGLPEEWARGEKIKLGEKYELPNDITRDVYATYALQVERVSRGRVEMCISDDVGLERQCATFVFG